jgi:dihydrofolate reductase
MPRIRYYAAATLDGYIARSDDSIDWLMEYEGSFEGGDPTRSYDAFYEEVGALVMGSATYEWLHEHMAKALESLGQEGNWPYVGKPTWVLSSRELPRIEGEGVDIRFASGEVSDLVDAMLEAAGGRDLWVVGGGDVASQFAAADRLDTLELTVVPVVLGEGKPLFTEELSGGPLQLVSVTPGASGMVELRYARSL